MLGRGEGSRMQDSENSVAKLRVLYLSSPKYLPRVAGTGELMNVSI
jgi:hypothetical protein